MPGYVIAEIDVTDPEGYEAYRKLTPPTIEKYGGKFLVRGGKVETLEGEWSPKRFIMTEFESFEQAKRWYESPEYTEAKKLRLKTATTNMIIVEGL